MAGTPASKKPWTARNSNNDSKEGLNASINVKNEEAIIEIVIMTLRPHASDNEPNKMRLKASVIVAIDKERLAVAGVILNSSEKDGNNGCVTYKFANVINPAANNAKFVFVNSFVPL